MGKIKDIVKKLTGGKDKIESRKTIFNYVRDIPYHIHPNQKILDAIQKERGNCGQKAKLLSKMLEEIDIKTKKISARYKTEDLPVPDKIKNADPMGIDYHLAVLAFVDRNWVLLDATADKSLEKLGFVVNSWDGKTNTEWFVKPQMTTYDGKGNKDKFKKKRDKWMEKINSHSEELKKFRELFNEYLRKNR